MRKNKCQAEDGLHNSRKMRACIINCELAVIIIAWPVILLATSGLTQQNTAKYFMVETSYLVICAIFEITFVWTESIHAHYDNDPPSFGLTVLFGLFLGFLNTWLLDSWLKELCRVQQFFGHHAIDWSALPHWLMIFCLAYAFSMAALTVYTQIGYRRDKCDCKIYNKTMLSEQEKPLSFLEYCQIKDPKPEPSSTAKKKP